MRDLVLITSAVNFIDGSALESLEHLIAELREAGVTFHLAEIKGPVMDRLGRTGFVRRLEPGRIFLTTHAAMEALGSKPGRVDARTSHRAPADSTNSELEVSIGDEPATQSAARSQKNAV